MRAQSAALGMAAAAALSSAATALPCAETSLGKPATGEMTCTVSDETSSPPVRDQQGEPAADARQDDSQPPTGQYALFLDVPELPAAETLDRGGIKSPNLQGTLAPHQHIAAALPPPAA